MGESFSVKEDGKEAEEQVEWGGGRGGAFHKGGTTPVEEAEVRKFKGTWWWSGRRRGSVHSRGEDQSSLCEMSRQAL